MRRGLFIHAFGVVISLVALGFGGISQAATINVLTRGDALLSIDYGGGRVRAVEFRADGTYRTSDGAFGRWELQGEDLCTFRDENSDVQNRAGAVSCGSLPADKSLGDVWEMPDADGNPIIVSIITKPVSSE